MPLRQRKEVQEMLRSLKEVGSQKSVRDGRTKRGVRIAAIFLSAGCAFGSIFPDQIGEFKKESPKTIGIPDQALYDEYGLDATEQAEYASASAKFSATAWRFRDSTGAMALFEARRPAGATLSNLSKLAAKASDGILFAYGNYVFQVTGAVPADVSPLYADLPKLEQSPLPALYGDLPQDGLIPNSERYVVGPVSLDRFFPGLTPSTVGFHLGAEAQIGKYVTDSGPLTLAVFEYPTPNMARERTDLFEKVPGAVARRVGPLVAITINPPDPDAAERILSRVKYETNITWNEQVPGEDVKVKTRFILNIIFASGALIGLCLIAGLLVGGVRIVSKKLNKGEDPQAMITLHLGGK
jgi:hypothetical protein